MEDTRHRDEAILAELRGFRQWSELAISEQNRRLKFIEDQVLKTNGRVNALEIEHAEARGRMKVTGVLWGAVSGIIVSVASLIIGKKI
jgi:hypothetical protein